MARRDEHDYDDEGAADRRSVQREGWRVEQSQGLVDGGARTEYFNFLRGARRQCRVGAGESGSLERFGWPVCRGWIGGETGGVSLDGRTPDFHPLSSSGATPSAPTSPPLPPPPSSLHHHSDCEQTDCEYSVVARGNLADDALGQINFRRRLVRRIKNKGLRYVQCTCRRTCN